MSVLDIDSAIRAHVAWRQQFQTAIEGVDADKLDTLAINDHTACQFGQWLAAPEQAHLAQTAGFAELAAAHQAFH